MKKFMIVLGLAAAVFTAFSGEREELLKVFAVENAAAEKDFQSADTTVRLTAGAGGMLYTAEKQLFRALDFKLRHTAPAEKRLRIIRDFHELSMEVQKMCATSREGMGSSAGMQIYHAAAELIWQHVAVLMLDQRSERLWERISNTVLQLNGSSIKLKNGKASFKTVMYKTKITLTMTLWPKDTFVYKNRDFALIRTDMPFSGNDDFSSVYLCERKNGKLVVHTRYKHPFFSKWTLYDNKLVIQYKQDKTEIAL